MICRICGEEFNVSAAKRRIGKLYGAGEYDSYFPNGDVCGSCAIEEMSPDYGSGEDQIDDMGSGWDPD